MIYRLFILSITAALTCNAPVNAAAPANGDEALAPLASSNGTKVIQADQPVHWDFQYWENMDFLPVLAGSIGDVKAEADICAEPQKAFSDIIERAEFVLNARAQQTGYDYQILKELESRSIKRFVDRHEKEPSEFPDCSIFDRSQNALTSWTAIEASAYIFKAQHP